VRTMFLELSSEFFQTSMGCGCVITFRQRPVPDSSDTEVVDKLVCPHGGTITLEPDAATEFTLDLVYMELP